MAEVVKGLEQVIGGLRKRAAGDVRKTHEILIEAAHMVLREIRPFVPVEFGDLVASGHVEAGIQGFFSNASVVFGGVAPSGRLVDYAVYVHENLEMGHTPPTCAKFMTVGYRLALPFVRRWIGAEFANTGPMVVNREVG